MANLEKIITLTDSQYQTLVNGGSITSGGKTYSFDANALYVVPEETIALSDIDGTTDLQAIENLTGTSGFLKKTGANTWSLDTNTYLTNVPLAANGTRGGVQIGYTTDATNRNYAVQLSSEKMYVNVPWTDNDTKVTSATNHYTPSTVSGQDKTASASGATAAWGIDVVQGITINTDGKGHITELNVTSGKIPANPNTDSKLAVAAVTSGTTYYPIVGTGTTAATRQYDTTGFVYKGTNGTTSVVGSAQLTLGNSTASGTANNKQGKLVLYGSTAYTHTISGAPTTARTLSLPDKSGTIAVTDDIPDISGKIDTAGTGLSKSGTTLNHSNSITKQDTQAVYPIKIDAQGHISAYGTAVTLGAAAAKGVTDNSSNADVTSSDTNLITARTLYYQLANKGYTTNTGTVTSVAASGSGGITISGSPITTSGTIAIGLNLSTAINNLGEGTSPAQLDDYLVAQYAGGGTTTTTYHRRKVSNVVNATVVKAALGTDSTHNNQFLRKDGTWQTPPYPVTSVAGNTGAITADALRTSLGLSNAMHFLGVTTTNISTGTANTTATVTIGSSNVTAAAGDVVLYGSQEYVWGNSKWNLLGDESSYKVKQTAKTDPTASTTTSTTFIDTISQDENGVITATKKTLPAYPTSFTITASTTDGLWDLTGTSGSNKVTYAVGAYSSKQSTAAFYTAATDPTLTTRLNYDGYLYATKLYSSGNEVLTTHQTIKQDGITGATITRFGTCSTAAGTAAKTISISSGTFALESGARVTVNFTNANTANNPTLNVNSKGAKNIFHRGARITTDVNKALLAGVCDFVYDGTQWHLIGNYYDTDTTYSSENAASGGATLSLVTTGEKYTWNNKANTATTLGGYGITDAKIASGVITLGNNTITPLTASSTLDATKLSGTIPSGCYTNSRDAGYGKITPANNTSTTSALTGNTTAVVASNYSENLKLTAANKWVVLAGTNSDTAGSDELKIAHLVPSSITNNGPTSNQTGSRGSTFNIPKITLDEAGHVTGISSITVSLPSSDNTDEKVKQNSSTTSAAYKLLMTTTASPTSGNTYETNYATTLSYNPSTKVLTNGTITLTSASSTSANGNAYDVLSLGNSTNVTSTTAHSEGKINIYSAATKSHIIVGKSTTTDYTHTLPNQTGLLVTLNSAAPSADIGSTTKPVYVSSAGVVTEANTYAGGTAVTLNGTSAASSTASFYAPTGAGTSGQYLKSNGSGAPSWTNFPTIPSITLNGSSTTSPSFYAPTGAGTSGQYLKSNGSGAPTWANMPAAVTATSSGSGNVVTGMSVTNNAITYTLGTVSTVSAQIVRW